MTTTTLNLILASLAITIPCHADLWAVQCPPTQPVSAVTPELPEYPDSVNFVIDGDSFTIYANGHGVRYTAHGDSTTFVISLPDGYVIETLYYFSYECDPVLVVGTSEWQRWYGTVTRLDRSSLEQVWRARPFTLFNIGEGLVAEGYLYITAIGMVAKLDLADGEYVWRHDGLWNAGAFTAFDRPRIVGDTVIFRANHGVELRVNKLTGKRLD